MEREIDLAPQVREFISNNPLDERKVQEEAFAIYQKRRNNPLSQSTAEDDYTTAEVVEAIRAYRRHQRTRA